MVFKHITWLIAILLMAAHCSGQVADTGELAAVRSCYDVTGYDLAIKVIPSTRTIEGYNVIAVRAVRGFSRMQLDLSAELTAARITRNGRPLPFTREKDALLIDLHLTEGQTATIRVDYHGTPREPAEADGGADWRENLTGKPWITFLASETGASRWWPCKDHPSDKADSARVRIAVPEGLTAVAAGTLRHLSPKRADGFREYEWSVRYPMAANALSVHVGDYTRIRDSYSAENGVKIPLDYYVLPYQAEKAKAHFQQVKEMLGCCEKYLGRYPFGRESFTLVEMPYLGRAFPGGIAYGNFYRNVPMYGFDQLLIHEMARSYFGLSLSGKTTSDRWIEESFATYLESLYLECRYGYAVAGQYLREQQRKIIGEYPIASLENTPPKDTDIAFKGAWMLHTLRNVVDDDERWFGTLKGLATTYRYQQVGTEDIVRYLNQRLGVDCTPFFNQYLFRAAPPILEFKAVENPRRYKLSFRWAVAAQGFNMPVEVTFDEGRTFQRLQPTKEWQTVTLRKPDGGRFRVAAEKYYVVTRQLSYKD